MPIFGHPLSSCLGQLGRQTSQNVGSTLSGQSGLSSLVSEMGSGSSPGCPRPCREGREGWCGGPQGCQKDPSRQPSPPGTTFSHTPRGLQLPPGRLQECGPDSAMLRAGSTAELSSSPTALWVPKTRVNRVLCPSRVPDLPQPPGPNTLQWGLTSLRTAEAPPPPAQTFFALPEAP